MKKKILISSFDLAIGGVERSLVGLLNQLDYSKYDVDIMLFKHEGEFLDLLPSSPKLLNEVPQYATFRKSIGEIVRDGYYQIGLSRLAARSFSSFYGRMKNIPEPGYLTIQYGWEMTCKFLPELSQEYDVAIGFLWPHHFIGQKVKAKKRIGWIHTDYSNITLNPRIEINMWRKLDHIVAVSEECMDQFLGLYPAFDEKTEVIENILSPAFIHEQAKIESPKEVNPATEKTIIVTVGRLSHAKGLDYAIHACVDLINRGYLIEWYVIGYGQLESELILLIEELQLEKHFFLLGKKVNPYPYIQVCDIYVQPSRYEGKAVTVREAQILGKPVVITDYPTAKSQAKDGVDALIAPLNAQGIAEKIKCLIDNKTLRDQLIENTKSKNYGNEDEIEKLYKLIES
ncbi:glycosyltransferase [Cytobacillus purgationiresistens]|uniref:Glycosyltransferase involved in cell wall biosynthesis n=1 Tax=Cytobacillus purgationiresistens TaxID=863449 RepID=A0ABU0AI50_9BACI|nr:glycosyltransferase [Cytobacillus purgationiresistens]MDQ0270929.1 glycosyltransferase involved in cell wall biosynthesis [Cytobacillus purgationiresistens]